MGWVTPTMGRPQSYTPLLQEEEEEEEGERQSSYSCPHQQSILDGEGRLEGFTRAPFFRHIVFLLLNILTLGLPRAILGSLKPRLLLALSARKVPLSKADRVLLTRFVQTDQVESEVICLIRTTPSNLISSHDTLSSGTTTVPLYRPSSPLEVSSLLKHQDSKTHLLQSPPLHRFFIYRHHKWVWNENDGGRFIRLSGLGGEEGSSSSLTCSQLLNDYSEGCLDSERTAGLCLHGPNCMEVEVKGYFALLVEEVLNPFYIFQLFSVLLWCLDDYVYYASCVLVISALSIGVALVETRRQAEMLRNMASCSEVGEVWIKRRGSISSTSSNTDYIVTVPSRDLIPGDILIIPRQGCILPCDAVLTEGSCLVNESMLTGESTPVQKTAIIPSPDAYHEEKHRRHTLFGGTEVLQTRYYPGASVTAVVVKTGFNTAKGELIHSILFPKPLDFQFYADALKFVGVLFALASVGMVYCVFIYLQRGTSWTITLLRVLDILTIVVPPALPAAMTVGTVYAQARLKSSSIFCTSPPRINFCGKLGLICFDKTGTLTEEGLDLWGVVPVSEESQSPTFLEPIHDPGAQLDENSPLLHAMASCHSLTHIHGRLVGDPLDLKMFGGTGWELEEPMPSGLEETSKFDMLTPTVVKSSHTELGILRELEFTPALQRMSVIIKSLSRPSEMILYCKGAPEQIRSLCTPSSIPQNYDAILDSYTVKGYRVLSLGQKPLSLKWHQLQRAHRSGLEQGLIFVGFLIMQNSVKEASVGVIRELNSAALRSVMVTGDNLLTALSVARECGIVGNGQRVILLELGEDENVTFREEDGGRGNKRQFSTEEEREEEEGRREDVRVWLEKEEMDFNYVFAMSGPIWNVLTQDESGGDVLDKIVAKGAVYARMSPENKSHLVERLQGIGYVVGMCGDGANDCSALKTAHVGISLSEAEASVAAPFTSKVPDISCVPKLIREGRCALVTSFGIFKYMALYSLVQFSSVLILYTHKTNLADTQFLWVDLAITTSIAIVMGRTQPARRLVPQRPSASLVSVRNVFSILVQVLLATSIQVGAIQLLSKQSWFHPVSPSTPDQLIFLCWETTTIFSVSAFQYLILAVVFSKGLPFRKPFYTNGAFVFIIVLLTAATLVLAAHPPPFLAYFFHLMPLGEPGSDQFRVIILALPVGNLLLSLLLESDWAQLGVKRCRRTLFGKKSYSTQKKAYKQILADLEKDRSWPPTTIPTNSY